MARSLYRIELSLMMVQFTPVLHVHACMIMYEVKLSIGGIIKQCMEHGYVDSPLGHEHFDLAATERCLLIAVAVILFP